MRSNILRLYLYFVYTTGLSLKPNVNRDVTTTLAALVMLSAELQRNCYFNDASLVVLPLSRQAALCCAGSLQLDCHS